jgi:NitT/TauT family transport system substrate-binding protein
VKLTPLAKGFITLVVLAVIGYSGWHYYSLSKPGAATPEGGAAKADPAKPAAGTPAQPEPAKRDPKRIIIGVNDFGGAYPGVVANDGAVPGPKSRFMALGLDVEIKLIRGSKERLQAFDSGEVDVMLLTLDYLANLAPVYKEKGSDLKAFLMADWSRGNLGIVAKPALNSIESLKDAKIATTRNTPTHYFLLNILKKSNLTPAEIERVKGNIVFATKTPLAGEMFQRGEVDAVAIWEPHLSQSTEGGKGRLLLSTNTASHLIADVLFARSSFIKAREADLKLLVKGWLEGVAALEKDPAGGVEVIAKAFGQSPEETKNVLGKIKPATFADNRVFFGLEREKAPYLSLFDDAARFWQAEGVIKQAVPAAETRWLGGLEASSKEHISEKVVETFTFTSAPKKDAPALLTKSVSIYFASGSDKIDPNAKRLIDQFAETLAELGNAYVRVEGNTDATGSRPKNLDLSKRRAQSLVDYLVAEHGFDRGRFQAIGNGPDNPIGDNATEPGREMNRRTDFRIIPNE